MTGHSGQHWTAEEIGDLLDAAPDTYGMRIAGVQLVGDETAWDPTSTKARHIVGPAVVFYRRYADGGIEVTVRRA